MIISHQQLGTVLGLTLPHELDISTRAAAAAQVERLLLTYRPHVRSVLLTPPATAHTPATLSVLARVRHLCEAHGLLLTVTEPAETAPQALSVAA